MPLYTYRCACGESADVLVRGREPASCDEVRELAGRCQDTSQACGGRLTRQLSAPYVGRGGGAERAPAADPSNCGHCGMTPGSCDN